jgi:hypothetical protein
MPCPHLAVHIDLERLLCCIQPHKVGADDAPHILHLARREAQQDLRAAAPRYDT